MTSKQRFTLGAPALFVVALASVAMSKPQGVGEEAPVSFKNNERADADVVNANFALVWEKARAATTCSNSLADQANPGACLMASSTPTPGMLFPPPHDGGINNDSSGIQSFVGGGMNNSASNDYSTIGGGQNNSVSGYYSVIGGGRGNLATYIDSVVGGGYYNRAGHTGAVGGGKFNDAGYQATVAGGYLNSALGQGATVAGGGSNSASGNFSTVVGGTYNTASGNRALAGGGDHNSAAGKFSTAIGGNGNAASADYSFAAGRRAKASHVGAFVWADSQSIDKTSSTANEFNVFASGGTRIFSDGFATTGVFLNPGSGSWASVSDRAAKEALELIDARAVLERLRALPLSTWNYIPEDDSVRHMGPMAQDFHAAFGLGANDRMIDTIDADGVALAAIQGLGELLDEKEAELEELRERVRRLEEMEERLLGIAQAK